MIKTTPKDNSEWLRLKRTLVTRFVKMSMSEPLGTLGYYQVQMGMWLRYFLKIVVAQNGINYEVCVSIMPLIPPFVPLNFDSFP